MRSHFALIKAERQARKLVTYLVYQHPWCNQATVPALKSALEGSTKVYFDGLLQGRDALYPRSIRHVVGKEYTRLRTRLSGANKHRNKIFHGQLTAQGLSRPDLVAFVTDIRTWCELLRTGAQADVGYDGCGRNSFRKASNQGVLCAKYKLPLANLAEYKQFIKAHMER
jgi:hypothetical protein